jgi:hypothetical protein
LEVNPNVVVLYLDNKAVACGCFKNKGKDTLEIKRMFLPEVRGRGFPKYFGFRTMGSGVRVFPFSFGNLR